MSDGTLATALVAMLAILARPRLRGWGRDDGAGELRALQQLGGTVYCVVSEDGHVRSVTENARHVLGEACDRAAELNLTMTELLQPDEAPELEAWLTCAWTADLPAPLVCLTRGPDAGSRWVELSTPGRLNVGSTDSVLVEVREVTARAERDRHHRMLAGALDACADAAFLTDADGCVEYVNGAFEQLTGYRARDVLGRTPSMLSSGRHRPEFFARMWQTLQAGQPFTGEVVNRRRDGTMYTVDLAITPIAEEGHAVRYLAMARDITGRKQVERELEDLAFYDALTGLANHRLLKERSRQILALARRHGSTAGLLYVDLENMAHVNGQHGRAIGDEVLRTVAERLKQGLRESDTLARTGSDEFLVLLSEVADSDAVARVVRRLHGSITKPFRIQDLTVTLGAHIGVALYPQDAGTFEELVESAELALRRAQHASSSFEFYERDQTIVSVERMSLEDDLHWAWEHDQFVLHYQPIVGADGVVVGAEALARGEMVGVEALARWPHLERGMIAPSQFIPLAERTGRILSLDRWAIATAARQAAAWTVTGWNGWISVNLSARTLHDPELPEYVGRVLRAHDLGPGRLAVEITEGTAMRDPAQTARMLEALRDLGVIVAVDDFGVGHSSLAYLKLFPVDLLKLDATFVRDIGSGGREEQLVEIMISLAHRIGARVVAEGVEHQEQRDWLQRAGCDYIQGYLIGRPAPPDAMPQPMNPPPGSETQPETDTR